MSTETTHKPNLRHLTIEDYDAVRQISAKAYKGLAAPHLVTNQILSFSRNCSMHR